MPLVLWSGAFSLNIAPIDEQHQRLVALINELHDALKVGEGKKVTSPILDGLSDYGQYHFGAEEACMAAYDYPGLEEHRKEHMKFRDMIRQFREDHETGNRMVSIEMMRFLMDWLIKHVQAVDRGYVPYLRDKDLSGCLSPL